MLDLEYPETKYFYPTVADIPDIDNIRIRKKNNSKFDVFKMGTVWEGYFGKKCPICGQKMNTSKGPAGGNLDENQITIDHILARSLSGDAKAYDNLMCVCNACNKQKNAYENFWLNFYAEVIGEERRKEVQTKKREHRHEIRRIHGYLKHFNYEDVNSVILDMEA